MDATWKDLYSGSLGNVKETKRYCGYSVMGTAPQYIPLVLTSGSGGGKCPERKLLQTVKYVTLEQSGQRDRRSVA